MVKNYLVTAIRQIRQGTRQNSDTNAYLAYKKMYDMSIASFRKFVSNPFEIIVFDDPVDDGDGICTANWYALKELWHREPCNIFWAGADTLMTKPTDIFGEVFNNRFREFRLFNSTDPKEHPELPHYFNDDLRYMPHTMSEEIWELGETLWLNRFTDPDLHWGFDQVRHNKMFWAQDIPDNDRCHPRLAYQCPNLRALDQGLIDMHDRWNGVLINSAHILHFHGSRGTEACIQIMSELCQQLDIQI